MHLEEGYNNPLSESWYLSSILKGLRRHKGDGINQELLITVSILQVLVLLFLALWFILRGNLF